ncbi:MAG: DUF1731 domain-containing protein, partial [candidate division Zixibacteria bacterium]|nr:DUF1731 domain-containing protein [candidate division Zixibacteria bacterium]
FGALLAKRLGRPFFVRTPGFILRLALGEMAVLALQGQRSIPKRLLDAGFTFDYPDAETAIDYCLREGGA